jgi:hypothetical protein
MVLITIIFAAVLPQFTIMFNSWDSKQGAAEAIQNGRVLMDHISRNLSEAKRITAVSGSTVTKGYIQFVDNNNLNDRYDIASADNYVEYGVVGSLSELAGPVSSFTFACYDACDNPLSPVTDTNAVRIVEVNATFTNSASHGQPKTFTTWVYLRTNGQKGGCWQDQDVGTPAATGSASYLSSSDAWTVIGSGADIWGTSDGFHYAYEPLSGDGQIVAEVNSITNTNSWAKAGVMIRETLASGSTYAMTMLTPGQGTDFQYRTTTNGSSISATTNGTGSSIVAPYWVKLNRTGSTFTSYYSSNGSNWIQIGSASITMATNAYIGLAVTSHNDGTLCTAYFNNINFLTYEDFNAAKAGSDTTSVTVFTEPNTVVGDLLIAAVAANGSVTILPPSGWNLINQGSDSLNQVTLGSWWQNASAAGANSNIFTWSGNHQAYGWIMRFKGQNATNPINNSAYASSSGTATPTSPAVTTTSNCCQILRLGAFDDDNNIVIGNPGLSGNSPITMDATGVVYWGFTEANLPSGGTTLTISKPTGTATGDLLVAAVVVYGITTNITATGWTSIGTQGNNTGNTVRLGVWYKQATASEAASYSFSWTGSQQAYGWIMRFSGHNSTTPINATGTAGTGTSASPASPSVTTTVANAMIVRIGAFPGNSININNTGLPANHINITMDESSASGNSCSGGAGYIKEEAAGACGASSFSLTASKSYRTLTFAIAPMGTTGTVTGGAGYLKQSLVGSSGTSTFSIGTANEARMLTIAIAPSDPNKNACCEGNILP